MARLLKVVGYKFFTVSRRSWDVVGADLLLEDGRMFTLYNIPRFIAIECLKLLNGYANDYRRSISEVLAEIPELEHAVSSAIESIAIDEFDPENEVYSATVRKRDGRVIKMIPSHAILLGIISGREVYVDERLVERQEEARGERP